MTRRTRLAVLLILAAALWIAIAAAFAAGFVTGTALAASRPAPIAAPPSGDGMTTERLVPLPLPDGSGQGEGPTSPGPSATVAPSHRITPSAVPPRSSAAPTIPPRTALLLRGVATWFDSPGGVSAAGPALRAALGPGWRGQTVTVCVGERCIDVVLGDWCLCGDRPGGPTVIDLHAPDFAALAPLSRGVVPVEVRP